MNSTKSNKVNVEDPPVSPIEEAARSSVVSSTRAGPVTASGPGTSYPSMAAVVVQDQSSSSSSSTMSMNMSRSMAMAMEMPASSSDARKGLSRGSITAANSASDFCVSEHEDEVSDVNENENVNVKVNLKRRVSSECESSPSSGNSRIIVNDDRDTSTSNSNSNATTSTTVTVSADNNSGPAEIPPETDGQVDPEEDDDDDDDDDESEYSYDYDEEDDGHFAGFLAYDGGHGAAVVPQEHSHSSDAPTESKSGGKKNIVEDEEATTTTHNTSAHASTSASNKSNNESTSSASDSKSGGMQFASLEATSAAVGSKTKWKEPTRAAVSMSLRAEREKSGGRRRLAADLYKVMMTDTQVAGFSVEQNDDECMDEWTVRLFKFDEDSDLHKDLLVLGLDHVELKMNFPEQYPFEPPFVRVVRPRFKRQTGFVMNGALCMELLTNEGWNPINDIESVIVSIRSLLVVGDGRVEAAANMTEKKREALLAAAINGGGKVSKQEVGGKRKREDTNVKDKKPATTGSYSTAEAKAAYSHLSNYHKKKGWSGWWAKRG